jgi:hypothetical protein
MEEDTTLNHPQLAEIVTKLGNVARFGCVVIPFEIDDSGDSLHTKEEDSPMGAIIEEEIP